MLIYGGYSCPGVQLYSDGVLVDTESKQVVRRLDAEDFTFCCARNRPCITEYGAVLAIVMSDRGNKMVEISTIDYSITVLKDLGY